MNHKYLLLVLLCSAAQLSWAMQAGAIEAAPEFTVRPSGLSLEEDADKFDQLKANLATFKIDKSTDYRAFRTAIINTTNAFSAYLANPALDPQIQETPEAQEVVKATRLCVAENYLYLFRLRANAEFLLTPAGQARLRKETEQRERRDFILKTTAAAICVAGTLYVVSNL